MSWAPYVIEDIDFVCAYLQQVKDVLAREADEPRNMNRVATYLSALRHETVNIAGALNLRHPERPPWEQRSERLREERPDLFVQGSDDA